MLVCKSITEVRCVLYVFYFSKKKSWKIILKKHINNSCCTTQVSDQLSAVDNLLVSDIIKRLWYLQSNYVLPNYCTCKWQSVVSKVCLLFSKLMA